MKEQYKKYTELVDKHKQLILDTERYLWKHPQVGYKGVGGDRISRSPV